MTDPVVDEIWRLVTAALKGGQPRFHVHVFPFRMTEANLSLRSHMQWMPFWRDLKQGYDVFEETQIPPRISVCQGRYAISRPPPNSDGSHDNRQPMRAGRRRQELSTLRFLQKMSISAVVHACSMAQHVHSGSERRDRGADDVEGSMYRKRTAACSLMALAASPSGRAR